MKSVKTNGKKCAPAVAGIGVDHVGDELVASSRRPTASGPGPARARRVPSTISAVTSTTTIVMNSAEFV